MNDCCHSPSTDLVQEEVDGGLLSGCRGADEDQVAYAVWVGQGELLCDKSSHGVRNDRRPVYVPRVHERNVGRERGPLEAVLRLGWTRCAGGHRAITVPTEVGDDDVRAWQQSVE